MRDVVLLMESSDSCNKICYCRICHEAEIESYNTLEAPCSCSGTVKFAHRECVQRWCNQKGNTTCEICLQKYEPGYTAPSHKKVNQIGAATLLNIRDRESLEVVPIIIRRSERYTREVENGSPTLSDRSSAVDTTATRCKLLALFFTVVLLVRNTTAVLTGETGDYPFTLSTLLILKAIGILIPMYILVRLITAIQNILRSQFQAFTYDMSNSEEEDEEQQHGVAIYS
ncbi:hypothetical protein LguiA_011320 [Lonicera macranthoides]